MDTQNSSNKKRSLEMLSVSGVLLGAIAALLAAVLGQNGIYGFLSSDSESENDKGSVTITNTNTNENRATGGNANNGNVNPTNTNSENASQTANPNASHTPGSVSNPEMTRAEYDQIQMGMTYQDVAAIVGSPGNRSSANGPFVTYEWDDGGPFGVSVTFSRDRVTMIGTYGHGADLFNP